MTVTHCFPGRVALFGSGETSATGGRVFEALARELAMPLQVAVLETPAGFEPNSAQVAGRVAEFMSLRLQNYRPHFKLIPARKKGTRYSPDDPDIVSPLLGANMIFVGPGSPTYAVRQLEASLAWHTLLARHRMGAAVVLASAAAIAASAHSLPVYEIYKVGADPHWQRGLDLFGAYGLDLVFIPHWNNNDGGIDLDTSRCFMGQERFAQLLELLPPQTMVVGIDEHTALVFDLQTLTCQVMGVGGVTLRERRFVHAQSFSIHELGAFHIPQPEFDIPTAVWQQARQAQTVLWQKDTPAGPPNEVLALVQQRQQARGRRDWAAADELRRQALLLGWQVSDTPDGPVVEPAGLA